MVPLPKVRDAGEEIVLDVLVGIFRLGTSEGEASNYGVKEEVEQTGLELAIMDF